MAGEGSGQRQSDEVKEAVRQILDGIIRNPWARAAGIVKKSFGRDEEGLGQGVVGDSALFASRIATLFGIGEKLLQEFDEQGPDRAELRTGETRILLLDLDADTVLVAVVDLTADGHAAAEGILEEARKRLRAMG